MLVLLYLRLFTLISNQNIIHKTLIKFSMSNAIYKVPTASNEPVYSYAPGSNERKALKEAIHTLRSREMDIPMYIGFEKVYTDNKISLSPPHDLAHKLGQYSKGDASHVKKAIDAALAAKKDWETMAWEDRAAIFLKAADLISGPHRAEFNAATMLCQSKNAYQSEIDSVCEFADFLRFNVQYLTEIYAQQPKSSKAIWNRTEYRPLEGFVFALTPFNFTAIAGNLPGTPALMGNTVVWKPAESQIYSANFIMKIFEEAGLPPGVINLVYVDGPIIGDLVFSHPEFAGLHFTGSTGVFKHIWKTIGNNLDIYKSFPRIVGETGGKDFVLAHPSADAKQVAVALTRGAFEFQGQKCSAASRAYIPKSLWPDVSAAMKSHLEEIKMGPVEDFSNFVNAVIDEKAFDKISSYIDSVRASDDAEIWYGGKYDKSKGYFIEPTVVIAKDPKYRTMCEEIFGPVLTVYIYEDDQFDQITELVDQTSPYSLTGSLFARERTVIRKTSDKLRYSAGNYYINDKPTGAVVGQQPFGGARASGTNDKAGSVLNLYRWISPRTIKENFTPPTDYKYPFLSGE